MRIVSSAGAKNHYERLVCQVIDAKGPQQVRELVRHIAKEMYYGELRYGAGVIDLGLFGSTLFEREAQELLESMVGRFIEVESEPTA